MMKSRKILTRTGKFILCFMPFLAYLLIQNLVGLFIYTVEAGKIVKAEGLSPTKEVIESILVALQSDVNLTLVIMLFSEVIGIVAFSLFLYFVMKEKYPARPREIFSLGNLLAVIFLFAGFELVVSGVLNLLQFIAPGLMADYAKRIEGMGITQLSFLSTMVAVILAPIAEEIVFRGLTFKLTRRFSKNFWTANFFQACIFGLAHMIDQILLLLMGENTTINPIQAVYAFVMGLILGYVYKKFNSLWATILAHLSFNLAGTWLVSLIYGADETVSVLKIFVVTAISSAVIFFCLNALKNDKKTRINEAGFNTKHHFESSDM